MTLLNKLAKCALFCVALLLPAAMFAQNKIAVQGVVKDVKGEPVIQAFVYEKGNQKNGAVTDLDGKFAISVNAGTILVASCVGFEDKEGVAAPRMSFILSESSTLLNETVVVGYGTQRKESVVGAIAQIDNEAIVNTGMTNVTQAIAGKLSGVLTMSTSGQPGANDATIMVRGVSSWNGSSPLCMVDGVERDFSDIDPNEIASISVLKDASATAVFGAKGANGVILVTTRSGIVGKPKMNLTVAQGFNIPALTPEHVAAADVAQGYNVAMMNSRTYSSMFTANDIAEYRNPSSKLNTLKYPDVDWYETMLKKFASSTNANYNISGGTKKTRYFISLGYKHEGSIFKTFQNFDKVSYKYDRLNYRANLDFNLTQTTTLSYKVGGDIGIKLNPDSSPISSMYQCTTIAFPAYYPEWALEMVPDWDYPNASGKRLVAGSSSALGSYYGNPYNKLNIASYDQTTEARLYTDLLLKQDLRFLTEGLSLNAKLSFSTDMIRDSESVSRSTESYYLNFDYLEAGQVNPWICSTTGTAVVENAPYAATQGEITSYNYTMYWEASANYDRTFNNHHLTALALFNQREYRSGAAFPYRNQGVVGRVTYDYKHKYLLEGNVGYTGSEQFAPSNRYGLFPSVALGYIVSEEPWFKKAFPGWSKLKLRYSDGYVGNDQTSSRWLYYSSYTKSGGLIYEDSAANTTAKWETAHKQDIGVEMGWFKNKLKMEADLFSEHRKDMLIDPVVTYLVGAAYKEVNKGEMKKHGYEVEIKWHDKFSNGLGYNLNAMYSFNENRIVKYEEPAYLPEYQKTAGKAYKGQASGETVVDGGYYTSVNDIHNYPSYSTNWDYVNVGSYKYLDYCVDGTINSNDLHAVKGSQYPSSLFSFGGGLEYKGWELSVLFYGNIGKYVNYNQSFEMEFVKGEVRLSASEADYWRPDNQSANHSTLEYAGSVGHPMYTWGGVTAGQSVSMGLVGRTWRNADYFTLRDLYFGKTFKTKKIKEMLGISSLNVYVTGNNLLYFTNLLEGNPEVMNLTSGYYPLMKAVQVGLKVGF